MWNSLWLLSNSVLPIFLCFCSSKLAAVLRKLHNANDMLQSSAYETSKPNSPNADEEMSVAQSNSSVGLVLNDDSQREIVCQPMDEHRGSEKTVDSDESATHECPAALVKLDLTCCYICLCTECILADHMQYRGCSFKWCTQRGGREPWPKPVRHRNFLMSFVHNHTTV